MRPNLYSLSQLALVGHKIDPALSTRNRIQLIRELSEYSRNCWRCAASYLETTHRISALVKLLQLCGVRTDPHIDVVYNLNGDSVLRPFVLMSIEQLERLHTRAHEYDLHSLPPRLLLRRELERDRLNNKANNRGPGHRLRNLLHVAMEDEISYGSPSDGESRNLQQS